MSDEENFDDDFEQEEEEPIALTIKDGVASLYEEPFCSIDCKTEQDLKDIQQAIKLKKLVEKEIKDKDYRFDISYNRMLKLLEDSKK